jgi:hypothetical protein
MSSLDQIISANGRAAGKVRGGGGFDRDSRRSAPYQVNQRASILDRLGRVGGKPQPASGTSVTISGLNDDINAQDISELCSTIGVVKSVNMQFDSSGRSTGISEVIFEKRTDAVSCVKKFNNVPLDGTPMIVLLTEDVGREEPNDTVGKFSLRPFNLDVGRNN